MSATHIHVNYLFKGDISVCFCESSLDDVTSPCNELVNYFAQTHGEI